MLLAAMCTLAACAERVEGEASHTARAVEPLRRTRVPATVAVDAYTRDATGLAAKLRAVIAMDDASRREAVRGMAGDVVRRSLAVDFEAARALTDAEIRRGEAALSEALDDAAGAEVTAVEAPARVRAALKVRPTVPLFRVTLRGGARVRTLDAFAWLGGRWTWLASPPDVVGETR